MIFNCWYRIIWSYICVLRVDSVREIDQRIREMKVEEYDEIRRHVIAMSKRLSEGYSFHQAMSEACRVLHV